MNINLEAQKALWRAKALEGTLTIEELKEAVILMRADRKGAAAASAGSRRAQAKVNIPSADDLLAEMGDI